MSPKQYLSIFLVMFQASSSQAWNATGHQVIAEIAYEHLDTTSKTEIRRLLSAFSVEYPKIHTLAQLGPWPDQLRSQKIEYYTHWHYVDVPFSTDGTPLKNLADTDNAAWALQKLEPVLANPYANRFERARALAFIVHIVADLHQPLHTVSRFSVHYPEGDKGGNLFSLTPSDNSANNLHRLWDNGLGLFAVPATRENVQALAESIMRHYPSSRFARQVGMLDEQQWIKEGNALAQHEAYKTPEHTRPNETYLLEGQKTVEMQTALAGYRLAALLNELLKNNVPTSL